MWHILKWIIARVVHIHKLVRPNQASEIHADICALRCVALFEQAQANVAQRRRRSQIHLEDGRNLRAGVEATVRQVKHPFPAGKLPVRGQFRVTCMVIGSAILSNIRRIQRYKTLKIEQINQEIKEIGKNDAHEGSFCQFLIRLFLCRINLQLTDICVFSC